MNPQSARPARGCNAPSQVGVVPRQHLPADRDRLLAGLPGAPRIIATQSAAANQRATPGPRPTTPVPAEPGRFPAPRSRLAPPRRNHPARPARRLLLSPQRGLQRGPDPSRPARGPSRRSERPAAHRPSASGPCRRVARGRKGPPSAGPAPGPVAPNLVQLGQRGPGPRPPRPSSHPGPALQLQEAPAMVTASSNLPARRSSSIRFTSPSRSSNCPGVDDGDPGTRAPSAVVLRSSIPQRMIEADDRLRILDRFIGPSHCISRLRAGPIAVVRNRLPTGGRTPGPRRTCSSLSAAPASDPAVAGFLPGWTGHGSRPAHGFVLPRSPRPRHVSERPCSAATPASSFLRSRLPRVNLGPSEPARRTVPARGSSRYQVDLPGRVLPGPG